MKVDSSRSRHRYQRQGADCNLAEFMDGSDPGESSRPRRGYGGNMRRATLALFVIAVSSSSVSADEPQYRKAEEFLLIASAVADLTTTEVFLSRGMAEANPLGQNRAVRIALKAGATAFTFLAARELEKDGHDKAARILRWVTIGGWFSVSGWNVYVTLN